MAVTPRAQSPTAFPPKVTGDTRRAALLLIAIVLFLTSAAPSAAATPTYTVPATIDKTGAQDVSTKLQRFIDAVPNGSKIAFRNQGVYRIGNGITLNGRHNLVFQGNGATLRSSGCNVSDSVFLIGSSSPSSGIVIRGFTLAGDNADAGTGAAYVVGCEYQMGVAIYRSSNIEIANVTIRRVHGDCVYIGGEGSPLIWSDDVRFHDSTCELTGRMGVNIVAASHVRIEAVHVDQTAISAFDIEPNGADGGASDVVITNNTVGAFGVSSLWNPWFFEANGASDAVVKNVTVSGNTLTVHPLLVKVQEPNRSNIVVQNNTSKVKGSGPVMRFAFTNGVTVTGNTQPLRRGRLASFLNCTGVIYNP